jgi:hypothetical protein
MPTAKKKFPTLSFSQLVEAVKKLSKKEKQKLLDILREEIPVTVPGSQKEFVRKSIKKYKENTALLIAEEDPVEYITSRKKEEKRATAVLKHKENAPAKKKILQGIKQAVKEINLVKAGKLKARDARDIINEL